MICHLRFTFARYSLDKQSHKKKLSEPLKILTDQTCEVPSRDSIEPFPQRQSLSVHLVKIRTRSRARNSRYAKRVVYENAACPRDARDCTHSYAITSQSRLQPDKLERADTRARLPASRLCAFRVCAHELKLSTELTPRMHRVYIIMRGGGVFEIIFVSSVDTFRFKNKKRYSATEIAEAAINDPFFCANTNSR